LFNSFKPYRSLAEQGYAKSRHHFFYYSVHKTFLMDSINAQQSEDTQKPLEGHLAVEKIRELAEKAKTCFFCTHIHQGGSVTTRPMSVQKVDEQGNFWFLSARDSYKNEEINNDSSVQLFFQGSAHSDFLSVYGQASIMGAFT
jgi:pyridoxine/pyridoxamine 5'-phosphate oxidase